MQYRIKAIAKLKARRTEAEVMKPCQIGYICELMADIKTNKWGEEICTSEEACQEWALSWSLPYTYNEEKRELIVIFKASRYYWLKETHYRNDGDVFGKDCKINGMSCGLYMTASQRMMAPSGDDELDVTAIIIRELTKVGWQEAVPLSLQPKITRDGLIAVKPTLLRIVGRFRKTIIEKLNGY